MRVDDVPPWLKPAFHLYGYAGASLFEAANHIIRTRCELVREPMQEATPDALGSRIECIWHEHLPTYMAVYLPAPRGVEYAWMNHPIWYMRPVHVLLAWNGVHKLALGSSGHGGRAALTRVVEYLREGCRTTMAVDGPSGPVRQLRPGALDMALASGRPLVAIQFSYGRAIRGPGWDRKWWPLPGSTIWIRESEPLYVNAENYAAQRERLLACL